MEKKNISNVGNTKKNENQLSRINTDTILAFLLLGKLKKLFYKQLCTLRQSKEIDLNVWENNFVSPYKEIWVTFENLFGLLLEIKVDDYIKDK